jgi:enoyl-[acyl-carrier protein] reductase I
MNNPVFPETKVALKGKKALIIGIANEHSIAWGCARAFRALGAEVAVTYLDERAKPYVEPLAKELEAPIFMPLNVNLEDKRRRCLSGLRRNGASLISCCTQLPFRQRKRCTAA